MAYKLRTEEEYQFMREFEENLPAILEWKRQYPKESWEDTFQKVTGKPWMHGRSVKEKGGRFEMTKDRTVKSVLGKYVALPAAYAGAVMLTGGAASPLLFGATGAGAGAGAAGAGAAGAGAGGAGAAAGTGAAAAKIGTAAKVAGIASRLAPVVSGAANRQSVSRQTDNANARLSDAAALDRWKINQTLPTHRLAQAMHAAKVARAKPLKVEWGGPGSGKFTGTGGYHDDLVGDEVRNMSEDVMRQYIEQQLRRETAPGATPPRDETGAEKALGWAGTGLNLYSAYRGGS